MSWLDALPLQRLVDGNAEAIVEWATDSASALVAADRNDARLRLLSRAIAAERARQAILGRLVDDCIAKRDMKSVETIDRVLTGTTKRLTMLLAEHRLACGRGQRQTVVAVAHADAVHVEAGE